MVGGFCGQSLRAQMVLSPPASGAHTTTFDINDYIFIAEIRPIDQPRISSQEMVRKSIVMDQIRTRQDREVGKKELFMGEIRVINKSLKSIELEVIFNAKHHSWDYSWKSNRWSDVQHVVDIIVLTYASSLDYRVCSYFTTSQFMIVSSHKKSVKKVASKATGLNVVVGQKDANAKKRPFGVMTSKSSNEAENGRKYNEDEEEDDDADSTEEQDLLDASTALSMLARHRSHNNNSNHVLMNYESMEAETTTSSNSLPLTTTKLRKVTKTANKAANKLVNKEESSLMQHSSSNILSMSTEAENTASTSDVNNVSTNAGNAHSMGRKQSFNPGVATSSFDSHGQVVGNEGVDEPATTSTEMGRSAPMTYSSAMVTDFTTHHEQDIMRLPWSHYPAGGNSMNSSGAANSSSAPMDPTLFYHPSQLLHNIEQPPLSVLTSTTSASGKQERPATNEHLVLLPGKAPREVSQRKWGMRSSSGSQATSKGKRGRAASTSAVVMSSKENDHHFLDESSSIYNSYLLQSSNASCSGDHTVVVPDPIDGPATSSASSLSNNYTKTANLVALKKLRADTIGSSSNLYSSSSSSQSASWMHVSTAVPAAITGNRFSLKSRPAFPTTTSTNMLSQHLQTPHYAFTNSLDMAHSQHTNAQSLLLPHTSTLASYPPANPATIPTTTSAFTSSAFSTLFNSATYMQLPGTEGTGDVKTAAEVASSANMMCFLPPKKR